MLSSVCVFLGAHPGRSGEYGRAAEAMGREVAARGMRLVYGGSCIGLMGRLADATLSAGGEVVGVIPRALVAKEIAHQGVTTLHVVDSMHERKAMMAELSDAFAALPGGLGTLEELSEVMTWSYLGFHAKPCGLLNVNGYFNALESFMEHMEAEGFLAPAYRGLLVKGDSPAALLDSLAALKPVPATRWVEREEQL